MAHFSHIGKDNIVDNVIVADQDFINSGIVGNPVEWVQTSYNTRHGLHYAPNSKNPDGGIALRKNYGSIGMYYDKEKDGFYYPIKPFESWILDDFSFDWIAPIPYPQDNKIYYWNEESLAWIEFTDPIEPLTAP